MKENKCLFCKIISGEISSATLYEDDLFRVILDVSPATVGHALILPKRHFENIYDMPEEEGSKLLLLAQEISKKLKDVLPCDGLNIVQNNGGCAGQTVFHFHMHLIPRYEEDHVCLEWTPGSLSEDRKEEILHLFSKE
jgi:histidine triad (HIT) family protein